MTVVYWIVNTHNNEVVIMQRFRKWAECVDWKSDGDFTEYEKNDRQHIQEMAIGTKEEFWETKLEKWLDTIVLNPGGIRITGVPKKICWCLGSSIEFL